MNRKTLALAALFEAASAAFLVHGCWRHFRLSLRCLSAANPTAYGTDPWCWFYAAAVIVLLPPFLRDAGHATQAASAEKENDDESGR